MASVLEKLLASDVRGLICRHLSLQEVHALEEALRATFYLNPQCRADQLILSAGMSPVGTLANATTPAAERTVGCLAQRMAASYRPTDRIIRRLLAVATAGRPVAVTAHRTARYIVVGYLHLAIAGRPGKATTVFLRSYAPRTIACVPTASTPLAGGVLACQDELPTRQAILAAMALVIQHRTHRLDPTNAWCELLHMFYPEPHFV
jgi:hypothetical protein